MRHLKRLTVGLLLALLLMPWAMAADGALTDLCYQAGEGATVSLQRVGGSYRLFLPASADLGALCLTFDGEPAILTVGDQSIPVTSGEPFDFAALYPEAPANGVYGFSLRREAEQISVSLMASEQIASLYITSADPVNLGRAWVETDKSNKAKGSLTMLRADGTVVYAGGLSQVKGRGNSTWYYPKKPYQIKLDKKTDLMETGEENEAAKTWVLLANYYDTSFIRNTLTYDLAADLDLDYSPHNRPVDLYYDGEYRGTYLLCEKTEVGTGRVEVHDLEEDFEDANPDVADFDDLPTAYGTNQYGNKFKYVTGLNDPADFSGGYLLEMDYVNRAEAEKSYFTTTNGYYIVSKSPEYLSETAMEYISSFYQEFEDAVFNGGVNPNTGKDYTDYVDLESLVKCYLILELTQDGDAYKSSTFFYKPSGEEKLYAGPVWDFDSAFGTYYKNYDVNELVAASTAIGRALMSIPSFCQAVQEIYESQLAPLVTDVILSTDPNAGTGRLRSITSYADEVTVSQRMDYVLWTDGGRKDLASSVASMRTFLTRRHQYLYSIDWMENISTLLRFIDVYASDWYFSAVAFVVDRGLFAGTADDQFSPKSAMTRGMVVTVFHRLAGFPEAEGDAAFSDVKPGTWYSDAVSWAAGAGIVSGYGDGTFHPNAAITRQELVSILYRYAQYAGIDVSSPDLPERFVDRDQVAQWAYPAFAWAVDRGVLAGTSATELSPQGTALRCMAAAIFQRYDMMFDPEN